MALSSRWWGHELGLISVCHCFCEKKKSATTQNRRYFSFLQLWNQSLTIMLCKFDLNLCLWLYIVQKSWYGRVDTCLKRFNICCGEDSRFLVDELTHSYDLVISILYWRANNTAEFITRHLKLKFECRSKISFLLTYFLRTVIKYR